MYLVKNKTKKLGCSESTLGTQTLFLPFSLCAVTSLTLTSVVLVRKGQNESGCQLMTTKGPAVKSEALRCHLLSLTRHVFQAPQLSVLGSPDRDPKLTLEKKSRESKQGQKDGYRNKPIPDFLNDF